MNYKPLAKWVPGPNLTFTSIWVGLLQVPIFHLTLVTGASCHTALTSTLARQARTLVVTGRVAADHAAVASCQREETENEMMVWNDNTGALNIMLVKLVLAACSQVDFINILRLRQNGHQFADNTFTFILLYQNCCVLIKISLKFVTYGPIDNKPALVQIMTWCCTGDKPL